MMHIFVVSNIVTPFPKKTSLVDGCSGEVAVSMTGRQLPFLWICWRPGSTWMGQQVQDEEFSLHGLTRIGGIDSAWQLQDLPSSLQHLDFCDEFTESLVQVHFPSGIKTLLWLSFQSKLGSHNSARRTSNLGFRK